MASLKGRHSVARAAEAGMRASEVLWPYCSRVEICGSIRRFRLIVGDVDIIAAAVDLDGVLKAIEDSGGDAGCVSAQMVIDEVAVDISFVSEETWGAALCHATGPKEENVRLRSIAKGRGLKLSQRGLLVRNTGSVIAASVEEDIYKALGEPFVQPEWRDVSSGRIGKEENEAILEQVFHSRRMETGVQS